jgi:hypothetical protein
MDGTEYAHGGISPQECIVPELVVAPLAALCGVRIESVEWVGMRLRVKAEGGDGLSADLRLGVEGDGGSIADRSRELDADGRTSLMVPDDMLMGRPAVLELRDKAGGVVATKATVVGG